MHPQLSAIADDFARQQARLHALVRATSEAAFAKRPSADAWSAAECVAHLNLTARAFLPPIRAALSIPHEAWAPAAPRRLRRDPAGWLVSVLAGPLPKLGRRRVGGVRAPKAFVPNGDLPRDVLIAEFDRLQAEQVALVQDADGAPIDRLRIQSPFDARLRYSVYSALYTLPRHQQRHIEQASFACGSG